MQTRRGIAPRERAAGRVAHLQPLDSYDDPGFGLGLDELRSLFRGEPIAEMDDVRLTQLVEAAIAVWSRLIGVAATDRESVRSRARLVALSAAVGWLDPDGTLHAPLGIENMSQLLDVTGWGGGEISWRKLHACGQIDLALEPGMPNRFLHLQSEDDHRALDLAWGAVAETVHKRLPPEVLSVFLSGPREIDGIRVPGVLQTTVLVLSWAPEAAQRAMVRALKLHSDRVGKDTLSNYAAQLNGFAKAAKEGAASHAVLRDHDWDAPWTSLRQATKSIAAKPAHETRRDTSSNGLLATRRNFVEADARLNRHRRVRDGALRPAAKTDCRRTTLLMCHLSTSGRIQMTSWIRPVDCQRDGVCGGYRGPLIWVMRNKIGDLALEPRPVHSRVIDAVDELCDLLGIPRDDTLPLFRTFEGQPLGARTLGQLFRQEGPRLGVLLARLSGEAVSSHVGRHLGANLAATVAGEIIEADPALRGAMDPLAVCDLWLGHSIGTDIYGYRDIMRRKTELLVRVGAGDPQRGIPGVADRLFGPAGARKMWDEDTARAHHEALQRSRERSRDLLIQASTAREEQAQIHRARIQIAIPEPEPLPAVVQQLQAMDPQQISSMPQRELSEWLLKLSLDTAAFQYRANERNVGVTLAAQHAVDERITTMAGLEARLDELREHHRQAERGADKAALELEKFQLRGPTKPVDDMAPTTGELRLTTGDPHAIAPEDETWEQLLARIATPHASPSERARRYLNTPEVQALCGLNPRWLQRARAGQSNSPLAVGIQRARWIDLGEKLSFVDADTLPLHLLLPTQLEFLDELLRVPMGTHHGGRRRSDGEIEAG